MTQKIHSELYDPEKYKDYYKRDRVTQRNRNVKK